MAKPLEEKPLAEKKINKQVTALMLGNLYSYYNLPQDAIPAYCLTTNTCKRYNLSVDAIAILKVV
ncbi:hypothetical protein [Nostoc sp. CALU 1950]|uniref:hypothetical protein n=1 Tax=Nostoc sp. CALU 1950 TaxID=3104321 RepID=UPI003EB9F65B